MRIAEIYRSRQGEGLLTGTESIFVRTSGCNLRCSFCDTPYTSWAPEGDDRSVEDILKQVLELSCEHVVITGGEPMLFAELLPLTRALKDTGHHITIETAGTLDLPVTCDLMSISPKLSNSVPTADRAGAWRERHERSRHVPPVIQALVQRYEYQVKFVVGTPADAEEVAVYLQQFAEIAPARVLLMPEGVDRDRLQQIGYWLEPWCRARGWKFCPRRHIEWYGAVRGT